MSCPMSRGGCSPRSRFNRTCSHPLLSVTACSVLFVAVRQLIPEDLVEVPAGPELARILAGIELSRLSGYDCVEVLKAQYRQVNHRRARLMTTMVEVGLCDIGPDDQLPRKAVPGEFAATRFAPR